MKEQTKEELIKQMRFAINTQMRYKLYNSIVFPYMPSMGIKHMFQGFKDDDNDIFIGVYHLYWTNEDNGIVVLNPTKPVPKGLWKHEWLTQEEALVIQKKVENESVVDYEKMTTAIQTATLEQYKKRKDAKEAEMSEEEGPVLN